MKIGILGIGRVGNALARSWSARGHDVCLGGRNPEKAADLAVAVGAGTRGGSLAEAAEHGDVAVLATPWGAAEEVLAAIGPRLVGKVLIDCTNPLKEHDFTEAAESLGDESAAEWIARWTPGARVVKAFNTIFSGAMSDPKFGEEVASMLYCGDDPAAKATVAALIADVGFEPVDAGELANARLLEPMALLAIRLAFRYGHGPKIGWKILRR